MFEWCNKYLWSDNGLWQFCEIHICITIYYCIYFVSLLVMWYLETFLVSMWSIIVVHHKIKTKITSISSQISSLHSMVIMSKPQFMHWNHIIVCTLIIGNKNILVAKNGISKQSSNRPLTYMDDLRVIYGCFPQRHFSFSYIKIYAVDINPFTAKDAIYGILVL